MIKITQAETANILDIQEIANTTWPQAFKDILSPDQIQYMMKMMYSTKSLTHQMQQYGHQFIIAKEDSRNLGYASFEVNYENLNKTKIHKIYILPDLQGKGLGKSIINSVMEMAKINKNHLLTLNVNRDNKAVKFYEYLGFSVVGKVDIPIGNGFIMEDFIMEKSI